MKLLWRFILRLQAMGFYGPPGAQEKPSKQLADALAALIQHVSSSQYAEATQSQDDELNQKQGMFTIQPHCKAPDSSHQPQRTENNKRRAFRTYAEEHERGEAKDCEQYPTHDSVTAFTGHHQRKGRRKETYASHVGTPNIWTRPERISGYIDKELATQDNDKDDTRC